MFRELFLQTCQTPIPREFRCWDMYVEWELAHRPYLDDRVALVRTIHEQTGYEGFDV